MNLSATEGLVQQRFQEIASFAESSLLRFANFFSSTKNNRLLSSQPFELMEN